MEFNLWNSFMHHVCGGTFDATQWILDPGAEIILSCGSHMFSTLGSGVCQHRICRVWELYRSKVFGKWNYKTKVAKLSVLNSTSHAKTFDVLAFYTYDKLYVLNLWNSFISCMWELYRSKVFKQWKKSWQTFCP